MQLVRVATLADEEPCQLVKSLLHTLPCLQTHRQILWDLRPVSVGYQECLYILCAKGRWEEEGEKEKRERWEERERGKKCKYNKSQ